MDINKLLDRMNEYLSVRRGLLPMVGIGLIFLNFILQLFPIIDGIWLVRSNLFLHLGLIVALIGLLLIKPLQ